MPATTPIEWSNWSGSVRCRPRRLARPGSEEELVELVRAGAADATGLRVAGSGHSFVPLCASDADLVSLERLAGVIDTDRGRRRATVFAGSVLADLGEPLLAAGLALETMGDIDRQSVAGALATGTHGTGRGLGCLSTAIVSARLVCADGRIEEIDDTRPELLRALRVSIGALGVVTRVRLRVLPAYRLHERTWSEPATSCLERLDERIADHRHFEFFWSSRHDTCFAKSLDPTEAAPDPLDGVDGERIDHCHRVFPSVRERRFNEMEYALPEAQGRDCFLEIRDLMLGAHRDVEWPVEYRTLAADDSLLGPASGRASVTISIHQGAELPWQRFFADAEAIFRRHGGRPHWGKMHSLDAADLEPLYPEWAVFQRLRRDLDPDGRFLSPYLRRLLGEPAPRAGEEPGRPRR